MAQIIEGVVGIVRIGNGYLLLPNGKENNGKRERHIAQLHYSSVAGLECLGGALKSGEKREQGLRREIWEEGKIPVCNQQMREAGFGVIVEQEGRGIFDVSVYFLELCWWQIALLKIFKHAEVISSANLDSRQIRRRDLDILQLVEGML